MDERTRFVADVRSGLHSISELCRRHGISRKTGYKWIHRYLEEGPAGLAERSHRTDAAGVVTEPRVVRALLETRGRHPTWGAKKLLAYLARKHPSWTLPAKSTAHDILRRNNLVPRRRTRRRPGHPGRPLTGFTEPNRIWTADFKGQFKTRDGVYCYPLTIQDGYSRFLLACQGLPGTRLEATKRVFTRVFRTYGLPERIRTDNGTPFASLALGRLSQLSAWWVRLGVIPELIEPGKPQQNGRHERMHRTLKAQTARPPAANLRAQQKRFDAFRAEFNRERPHEALRMKVPAELYRPSDRPYPKHLKSFVYPGHYEVRKVSTNGGVRWNAQWLWVSQILGGLYIGFEEVDHEAWDVYFGPVLLGRLFEKKGRILDPRGLVMRNPKT
jgi:transposase InsO family protein